MPRGKKNMAAKIIGQLREAEVEFARGKAVAEVVRQLGVTEQPYYRWKREYGGLQTDLAKREKGNARRSGVRRWSMCETPLAATW